jgi:hypothetical protein
VGNSGATLPDVARPRRVRVARGFGSSTAFVDAGATVAAPRDYLGGKPETVERRYWFAWDSSQSARLVKPTITASIQYWERIASFASS